jgi:hypothetical protein
VWLLCSSFVCCLAKLMPATLNLRGM